MNEVQTITVSRQEAMAELMRRKLVSKQPGWRETDPPATTVGELSPDDVGKRVVIRSGDFLGTVYGTLLAVSPHSNLVSFTCVQLYGKKALTFRNDLEALVVG